MSAQNIGVLVLMCALLLSIPYFISVYKHVRIVEEVRADMAIKWEKCRVGGYMGSHVSVYTRKQVKAQACVSK